MLHFFISSLFVMTALPFISLPVAEMVSRDDGGKKAFKNLNALADELTSGALRGALPENFGKRKGS